MLPKYEHTQKPSPLIRYIAIFTILELLAIEAVVFIFGTRGPEALPKNQLIVIMLLIPLVHGVILGWAGLMMSSLTVTIDREFIRLKFGAGMWKKKISLDEITECSPVKNTWANGWGIRYLGKGCWLYNIAGLSAVEVACQNGKKTRIGTDESEKLAAAIRQAIGSD